jgi:hypothetical protein
MTSSSHCVEAVQDCTDLKGPRVEAGSVQSGGSSMPSVPSRGQPQYHTLHRKHAICNRPQKANIQTGTQRQLVPCRQHTRAETTNSGMRGGTPAHRGCQNTVPVQPESGLVRFTKKKKQYPPCSKGVITLCMYSHFACTYLESWVRARECAQQNMQPQEQGSSETAQQDVASVRGTTNSAAGCARSTPPEGMCWSTHAQQKPEQNTASSSVCCSDSSCNKSHAHRQHPQHCSGMPTKSKTCNVCRARGEQAG